MPRTSGKDPSPLFPSPGALGPRSSFARCLYIQETLGKESDLDSFILLVVFVLVALSMAEDQRQQQLMCRLRRILLPLPLRPKKKATGSVLRWLGTLLLTINELIISLVAPMLPFGVVFLMLTQGAWTTIIRLPHPPKIVLEPYSSVYI